MEQQPQVGAGGRAASRLPPPAFLASNLSLQPSPPAIGGLYLATGGATAAVTGAMIGFRWKAASLLPFQPHALVYRLQPLLFVVARGMLPL